MRAILIDPYAHTVTETEYNGDWQTIGPLLGAEYFTVATLANGDSAFVDDEGLFTQTAFFKIDSYHQPLAGKALILGVDDEGDSIPPSMTLAEAQEAVRWVLAV